MTARRRRLRTMQARRSTTAPSRTRQKRGARAWRTRSWAVLAGGCMVRGAEQRGAGFEGDADVEMAGPRGEPALGGEPREEPRLLQRGQDLGRDAAADHDATGRQAAQREVAGLGAEDLDEHVERADAGRIAAGERGLRDRRVAIAAAPGLGRQPGRDRK